MQIWEMDFPELVEKKLKGTLTPQEKAELERIYKEAQVSKPNPGARPNKLKQKE